MADAITLARAQFAFTLGFHIVLPAFTIGLASYLMVLEALWLNTRRQVYLDVFQVPGCASSPSSSPWAWFPAW